MSTNKSSEKGRGKVTNTNWRSSSEKHPASYHLWCCGRLLLTKLGCKWTFRLLRWMFSLLGLGTELRNFKGRLPMEMHQYYRVYSKFLRSTVAIFPLIAEGGSIECGKLKRLRDCYHFTTSRLISNWKDIGHWISEGTSGCSKGKTKYLMTLLDNS